MKIKGAILCLILAVSVGAISQKQSVVSENGPLPGMKFVKVNTGSFFMGSKKTVGNERNRGRFENLISNDAPFHKVNLKSFLIMTTEVTCGQWTRVMGGNPPADPYLAKGNVTHQDVMRFIRKLNEMDPGKNYRLPSEAEWEYACWAGTPNDGTSVFAEEYLERVAWTQNNSGKKVQRVGLKEPNAWGLYDMLGNVLEWCEDEYHPSYEGAPTDGSVWMTSPSPEKGVMRGGDCLLELFRCAPYARDWMFRNKNPHISVGFRLVRDEISPPR
jgi:formylglycine-generating enzyme required for sulfatase activity